MKGTAKAVCCIFVFMAAFAMIFIFVSGRAAAQRGPDSDFPLYPGTHWEYEMVPTDGSDPFARMLVVRRIEDNEGSLRYTLLQSDKRNQGNLYISFQDGCFYLDALDAQFVFGIGMRVKFAPRLALFSIPLQPNYRQDTDSVARNIFIRRRLHVQSEVMRVEKLSLPVGEWDCLLIHVVRSWDRSAPADIYVWFAPGVGMVKFTTAKITGTLQSYILAKAPVHETSGAAAASMRPYK